MPVVALIAPTAVAAVSLKLVLKNRDLEKIANGLRVNVSLTNENAVAVTATIIVVLTDKDGGPSHSDTRSLGVPANGYNYIYPWTFPNLIVGHTYTGQITVTAPGFAKIESPTAPAERLVDQWG